MAPGNKNERGYMEDRGKGTLALLMKGILAIASPVAHPKVTWLWTVTGNTWHRGCSGDSGSEGVIVPDNF